MAWMRRHAEVLPVSCGYWMVFADWPGNNRIASLRNLQDDDRLAMLFLFPGLETFLRINGRGRVSSDGDLMQELREGIKVPKTAIVIRIDEVLFHCGRAINRARLWRDESSGPQSSAYSRRCDGWPGPIAG